MNKKRLRILEILWLIVAIFCLLAGIHNITVSGFNTSGVIIFLMALVSFGMYLFRRNMRQKSKDN